MMKHTCKRAGCALLLAGLLLLTCLTPALAAYPDAYFNGMQNFVENPGFEQGLAGWETSGDISLTKGLHGRYSAFIGNSPGSMMSQRVTLPQAGKYVLRIYTKNKRPGLAPQSISVNLTDGKGLLYANIMQPADSWQMIEGSFTLAEKFAGKPLEFVVAFEENTGVLIDDLVITPADSLPAPDAPQMEKNLLPNPGFEEGVSDWSVLTGEAPIEKGQIAHTGKKSLFLDGTGEQTNIISSPILPPLQKGMYEIIAHIFVPSQMVTKGDFSLRLSKKSNNKTEIISGIYFMLEADNAWHEVRFSTYLDPVEDLHIYFINDSYNTFFLDDVSIVPLDAPQGNLLENPGFEAGLQSWNAAGSAVTATSEESDAGMGAAQFAYSTLAPLEETLTQTCPVTQAGTYTASARILPGSTLLGGGGLLLLEARDKDGRLLVSAASGAVSSPQGEWGLAEATLTVPEAAATLTVKLGGAYCTGTFYVDSVCLVQGLD